MTIFRFNTYFTFILAFAFAMLLSPTLKAQQATEALPTTQTPAPDASDIDAARMALAREYIAKVPVGEEIKSAVENLSSQIAPDQRILFRSLADKNIDYNRLQEMATISAAKTFSEAELKAMIAFFSTPEGQSTRQKMASYQEMVQPYIAEELRNFVEKLQENNITPMQAAQ